MNEAATNWIDRNASVLSGIAIIGTCLCFFAFGYLLVQNGKRASEGAEAKKRQQAVYPVSMKVYEDANVRGVITRAELACFKDSSKCPPPKRARP